MNKIKKKKKKKIFLKIYLNYNIINKHLNLYNYLK